MKINILKLLSITIFCFSLCTDAQSMEDTTEKDYLGKTRISRSDPVIAENVGKSDDCHWGLKHWIYGIKEYIIDRSLFCGYKCCVDYSTPFNRAYAKCGYEYCGFDPIDEDRAYIKEYDSGYDIVTTDCWLVAQIANSFPVDDWISGPLCFPFATITHLLCLPVLCCYPTKAGWWGAEAERMSKNVRKYKDRKECNEESDSSDDISPYGTVMTNEEMMRTITSNIVYTNNAYNTLATQSRRP